MIADFYWCDQQFMQKRCAEQEYLKKFNCVMEFNMS